MIPNLLAGNVSATLNERRLQMEMNEFREVESIEFETWANVASGVSAFVSAISRSPSVIALRERIRSDSAVADKLLTRMLHLKNLDIDSKYENPNDVAMATYGWVVANERPELAGELRILLGSLKNPWWSKYLAN